jgi:hypothetical protein
VPPMTDAKGSKPASKSVLILYKRDVDDLQALINKHIGDYFLVGAVNCVVTINGTLWFATMQLRFDVNAMELAT